jgi:signal peptidase complex subunit 2
VVVEEEEVVYEELPQPHVIETGDSIKVKQVLDDATMAAITDAGYIANYSWENFKLFLMFLSCLFAVTAQFFPIPFPSSRPLLAVCCASYFIISSILQFIVTFIDKDTIMFTRPKDVRTIFLIDILIAGYLFFILRVLLLFLGTRRGIKN